MCVTGTEYRLRAASTTPCSTQSVSRSRLGHEHDLVGREVAQTVVGRLQRVVGTRLAAGRDPRAGE